jgi:hypothetical protein
MLENPGMVKKEFLANLPKKVVAYESYRLNFTILMKRLQSN